MATATQTAALTVRDLQVMAKLRRERKVILRGVDLDLQPGEILGIVGESGSGKSTLCRALARILPLGLTVERGMARLGDTDLLAGPPSRVHGMAQGGVGMIFQEPRAALNPVMRVGDQLIEAVQARTSLGRREARADAVKLLERLGLPEPERRMSSYPDEFSGGQCQRLVTAVALAGNPSVLLADEPTSALDVTTQAQILELLRELVQERRMGMVVVSHNYAVVAQLCSRTLVMYGGKVVEEGPTAELLFRPRHPYTSALIGSLPDVDHRVDELAVIPGRPPVAGEAVDGCPFRPRCPHAEDVCAQGDPPLEPVVPGHRSACVRVREIWPAHGQSAAGTHSL